MDPNTIKAEIADLESKRKALVSKQNKAKKEKEQLNDEISNIGTARKKLNEEIEQALSAVKTKLSGLPRSDTMFAILLEERSRNLIQGKGMNEALDELSKADKEAKKQYQTCNSNITKYGRQINDIDQKIQDLKHQLSAYAQAEEAADSI